MHLVLSFREFDLICRNWQDDKDGWKLEIFYMWKGKEISCITWQIATNDFKLDWCKAVANDIRTIGNEKDVHSIIDKLVETTQILRPNVEKEMVKNNYERGTSDG